MYDKRAEIEDMSINWLDLDKRIFGQENCSNVSNNPKSVEIRNNVGLFGQDKLLRDTEIPISL